MKQIEEKYLVLIAAFFALIIGGYTVYSVTKIVAQHDGNCPSSDPHCNDGTTDPPEDDPPPEEDENRNPPEDDPSGDDPHEDDSHIPPEDDSDDTNDKSDTSTSSDHYYPPKEDTTSTTGKTDDKDYDKSDKSDTSSKETHEAPAGSGKWHDPAQDKFKSDLSTTLVTKDPYHHIDEYKPHDPTYTATVQHDVIKLQDNPYIDTSSGDSAVNVKEYVEKFVPRSEAEDVFKRQQHELSEEEKQKLEKAKKEAKLDSDNDGIPDYEEIRLGTNIFTADSDGDGFKDGDELKNGFDPRKYSAGDGSDKVSYQDPEDLKEISEVFKVTKIEPKEVMMSKEEEKDKDEFELAGTALPNSMVTLYIYSDPIVVTVQADNDGNWYYVLDKELEEGEHKVYATVTDSTGKVTARSEGMTFVKTAKALDEAEVETSQMENQTASPVKKAKSNMTLVGLVIAIVSVILAILSIGYFVKTREHHAKKKQGKGATEGSSDSQNQE